MSQTTRISSKTTAAFFIGLLGVTASSVLTVALSSAEMGVPAGEDKQASEQLAKGQYSVMGKVLKIASDQIKVDIGEVRPRYLPLKPTREKFFGNIKEGDELIITLNDHNLIVDFHPLTDGFQGTIANHRIIRGEIAEALVTGHQSVVIRADGKEQTFPIRSQARSKVAALSVGQGAIFLIDETGQVADVSFTPQDPANKTLHQDAGIRIPPEQMSGKGMNPHEQVSGTVVLPLGENPPKITVRTEGGSETTFEVRELLHSKIAQLSKGGRVVLLVDGERKVIDVAVPPREGYR
jgi:hypothetical protein